jgi:beta-glucosidase
MPHSNTSARRADRSWLRGPLLGSVCSALLAGSSALAKAPPEAQVCASAVAPVITDPIDRRAQDLVERMTRAEKIRLVTGQWGLTILHFKAHPAALGGDGFVAGTPRLGIPDLQLIGAGMGVTNLGRRANGQSTALPAAIALASSFDTDLSYAFGTVIGRETRDQGFNVSLGGGVNLTRDPRGGRAFEYYGEDPLLAGKMIAPQLRAIQDQGVVATIKHYALNDQETGRFGVNAVIDERAMREAELLAFEIGIKESGVGSVMCAYNRVNGDYTCESDYLLNRVLKGEWGFKGWVMSDWGSTHSTAKAALAGLDQEFFAGDRFGQSLSDAIDRGEVPAARLDDMVRRILRSMIAVGVLEAPARIQPIDAATGGEVALRAAREGAVLLKNSGLLPLSGQRALRLAVVGMNADKGVLSGGGSSQVNPVGGNAVPPKTIPAGPLGYAHVPVWDPSPPLSAIKSKLKKGEVRYESGEDRQAAADLARWADVVVVLAGRRRIEGLDAPDLSLGEGQDELIAGLASVNPNTVVVLETGGAVTMPWLDAVQAVLEVWYPGQRGGEAIADLLFGDANPSGKLPLTFPRSESDLPRLAIRGTVKDHATLEDLLHPELFDVELSEGLQIGYKWYDAQNKFVLFPFGHGLSYTQFSYNSLKAGLGESVQVRFELRNTGARPGAEVAQIYVGLPASTGEPPRRLAGWSRVELAAGERREVSVRLDPKALAIWSVAAQRWEIPAGTYQLHVGGSSRDLPLTASLTIPVTRWVP